MASCEFCNAEGQKAGQCAYCGTGKYTSGASFIYGKKEGEACACEFTLTDKYLIVRSLSAGETMGMAAAGAAFGVLGVLTAAAVNAAIDKSYGFYDLQEVEKVIFPYFTKGIKKELAFKFVNKDGTDFVLLFNQSGFSGKKVAKTFSEVLPKLGIPMEDGTGRQNEVCCEKPFVDAKTFGLRVCQSAAAFVKLEKKQFVVAPMETEAQKPATVAEEIPVAPVVETPVEPVAEVPVEPVVETPVAPVAEVPVEPVVETPVAPVAETPVEPVAEIPTEPVAEAKEELIFCGSCGASDRKDAKFCRQCGKPFAAPQPVVAVEPEIPVKPVAEVKPLAEDVKPAAAAQPAYCFCPKCGTKSTANTKFCGKCGSYIG